jgi:hypothetical protein
VLFNNKISDDGIVNTLKELVDYVANHGGEIDTIVADIAALHDLVGVEKVSEQINTAVSGKVDAEEGKSLVSDDLITKLEGVEEGAQVNNINGIYLGETLLESFDKFVTIPIATADTLGVVKGSNEIVVAKDGSLSIGTINFDKITQSEEDVFIMDGGGAV